MSHYSRRLQVTDTAIAQSEQALPAARAMLMRNLCETYRELGNPPLSALPIFSEEPWPMTNEITLDMDESRPKLSFRQGVVLGWSMRTTDG